LSPPAWLHPIVLVLMWFAFVALAAAYSPPGWIKGMLRHPMLVGVKAGRSPTCWPTAISARWCCSAPSWGGL
jgi:hypothetical protein